MTVLNDLSTEIFLQIFSLLQPEDLARACRVCQRWHAMGEELLFTDGSLEAGGGIPLSLRSFLRTIQDRPSLAAHVKFLLVDWRMSGSSERVHSEMLLLQQSLTSLQTLHVRPPIQLRMRRPFPAGPPGAAPTFQSLREFTWGQVDSRSSGIGPTQLLTLPCIRHITVDMAPGPDMDSIPREILTPLAGTSTVTHLALSDGNMSATGLTRILQLPRALTHLRYDGRVGNADVPLFRVALACVRATLQYLRIGDCAAFGDDGRWNAHRGIGPLKDWPALRSVGGSLVVFIGPCEGVTDTLAGIMPAVLREMVITLGGGEWVGEGVRDQIGMMVGGEGALRRLEVVRVGRGVLVGQGGVFGDEVDPLGELCKAAGVEFVVES